MVKKTIFIISLGLLTLSLSTAFPQTQHESNPISFPKEGESFKPKNGALGNENDRFRNNQPENMNRMEENEEKHSMIDSNSERQTNGRENLQSNHSKIGLCKIGYLRRIHSFSTIMQNLVLMKWL